VSEMARVTDASYQNIVNKSQEYFISVVNEFTKFVFTSEVKGSTE
jgi:hypothetical protein